jgi:FtsX-like permease family
MSWFNQFSNLFRRENVDEELDEELQFHLDARTRDNLNAGMSAEAAQHDARRRFGNATLAKERAHEMNIVISIETIGRDLRYALRSLRKSPGFTMVALLTLALGVGANTAVFSLNRAPDVVGRTMVIANTPFTVVGVMAKRFIGPDPTQKPEIYAPLSADPVIDAPRNHIDDGIHAWWLIVGARLRPGISMEQANAALLTISNPILHEAGAADARFIAEKEKGHFHFVAEPGSKGYIYARFLFRKPLVAMFAMCGGILLLACLNLASLLMARGVARQRELATRLAMGATRRRIIQQLLTESLTIAVLGTAAGLAAAPLVSHSLAALAENGWTEMRLDTSLDLNVFVFAALIAIVSSILIGLAPALQAAGGSIAHRTWWGARWSSPTHPLPLWE